MMVVRQVTQQATGLVIFHPTYCAIPYIVTHLSNDLYISLAFVSARLQL